MSQKELEVKLAKLEKENQALKEKNAKQQELKCKVAAKGGVSVYGLNARWPITLYAGQWERLEAYMPEIIKFIKVNESKLSRKDKDDAEEAE